MQLSSDYAGFELLFNTVRLYYSNTGNRQLNIFSQELPDANGRYQIRFLVDRKYVVQYSIGEDRGYFLGGLALAIGPQYFGPADFWSYENSERFAMGATTDCITQNLSLLDEFLGYKC